MPVREVAAKRYAQAIFGIARDADAFDRWRADLERLHALVAEPTVGGFLTSTTTPEARKTELLQQGLEGVDPQVLNFARLLVRKRRLPLIEEIVEIFDELLNDQRGVVRACITTAVPLTDNARTQLSAAIRTTAGATEVVLQEDVAREVLGGAVLRIGDHLVDGSVRTRLHGLRQSVAGRSR